MTEIEFESVPRSICARASLGSAQKHSRRELFREDRPDGVRANLHRRECTFVIQRHGPLASRSPGAGGWQLEWFTF